MAWLQRFVALTALLVLQCLVLRAKGQQQEEEDLAFFMPQAPPQPPEKLQRVYSLASTLREKSLKEPKAVQLAVSAAASTLPPVPLVRGLRVLRQLPPEAHAHLPIAIELLASIRELGTAAACIDHPATPHGPPRDLKYLIAANLYECEAIMPFWILEVLRLALLLRNDALLQRAYFHTNSTSSTGGSVSISIYESGSTDNTVPWLRIAEALWTAASIPNTVVINGLLTRRTMMDSNSGRFYKQHRIQYLASLRNAAMEPLYSSPTGTYDFVMFINDVFFCSPDVLRLAHLDADIACGLDFEVWVGNKKGRMSGVTQRFTAEKRRLLSFLDQGASAASTGAAAAVAGGQDGTGASAALSDWRAAIEHMSQVHVEEAARQAAADARVQAARIKPRYEFYDTWVSRDIGGNPYIKTDPISRDTRTIDNLHRGLPIPAKCCWNGMALINVSHITNGLRFRPAMTQDGEFDISECSLFCEDYRRLGSTRVAVDPSVRVSYLVWTKEFHGKLPGGVGAKVPWSMVQRSGALEELKKIWSDTESDYSVQWIPLRKGSEEAALEKFRVIDLRIVNYTDIFLKRLRNPRPPPPPITTCNLFMGPYGASSDGMAFDDLSASSMGTKAITGLTYSNTTGGLASIQMVYGDTAGPTHGSGANTSTTITLSSSEAINRVAIFYDDTVVQGLQITTTLGRNLTLGNTPDTVSMAWAVPCPGKNWQEPVHKLTAIAGTADKMVRSIILIWS